MSLKRESKKVTKLINKKGYVPFMDGLKIIFVAKDTNVYYVKNSLKIEEV